MSSLCCLHLYPLMLYVIPWYPAHVLCFPLSCKICTCLFKDLVYQYFTGSLSIILFWFLTLMEIKAFRFILCIEMTMTISMWSIFAFLLRFYLENRPFKSLYYLEILFAQIPIFLLLVVELLKSFILDQELENLIFCCF